MPRFGFFALATNRNRVLAVSHAVANRFRGTLRRLFMRRVPIAVIHNAADLELFQLDRNSRPRRALGGYGRRIWNVATLSVKVLQQRAASAI